MAGAGSLYLTLYFDWEQVFLIVSTIIFFLMILIIFVIPSKNNHTSSNKSHSPFKEFVFKSYC